MAKPKPSLPLADAFGAYSDPEIWKEFQELRDRGRDSDTYAVFAWSTTPLPEDEEFGRCSELKGRLWVAFVGKLRDSQLISSGYDSRHGLERRIPIPAEAWAFLMPNFEESKAEGGGLTFLAVAVSKAAVPTEPAKSTKPLESRCRVWLKDQVRQRKGQAPPKKSELLQLAQREMNVPIRMFDDVWRSVAPKRWKKPGRKPE